MNNWRLQVLALVAVFQPIASFTERNIVDGRQQCCERYSPTTLEDTRSSLYYTYRLGKDTRLLEHISAWDNTLENQRYATISRNIIREYRSTDRLLDTPALEPRQDGSFRVERSSRRIATEQNRKDLFGLRARARSLSEDSRYALGQQDDTRSHRFSRERKLDNYSNERLSNVFGSRRVLQLSRNIRNEPNRIQQGNVRKDARRLNSALATRDLMTTQRRETFANDRREMEINREQRRTGSSNAMNYERGGILHIRLSSRKVDRQNNRRASGTRHINERFYETRQQRGDYRESREVNKENRRHERENRVANILSSEKSLVEQRNIREFRAFNDRDMDLQQLRRNTNDRVLRENRIQVERRRSHDSRIINDMVNTNERDSTRGRVSKSYERLSIENRATATLRQSQENTQDRRIQVRSVNNVMDRNERDFLSQREMRHSDRSSLDNRENYDRRISRERIQMNRRVVQKFRNLNDMTSRMGDIRYDERLSRTDSNPETTLIRERVQTDRINNREFRALNQRAFENRREVRNSDRLSMAKRNNIDRRLSHESNAIGKKNILEEFRTLNNNNERDVDNRREIRLNSRLTRESRMDVSDQKRSENRQVIRRDIRDSRISRSMLGRIERNIENRRDINTQIRDNAASSERRVESRSLDRFTEGAEDLAGRRTRSEVYRNFREIRTDPQMSRFAVRATRDEHRYGPENRDRESSESRSRRVDRTSNRERVSNMLTTKLETENYASIATWQNVIFALQGAYMFAFFMQMWTPNQSGKRHTIMSLRWLPRSSHYNPIKVD